MDAGQIGAAQAGLARHAGGYDAHCGAGDVGIIVGALEPGVEAFGRPRLREIERLALGDALGDVEQDDITQFLHRGEVGERAADHAGADQRDLLARSEEHTSELQSLMRISYAVFCLNKKKTLNRKKRTYT